MSLPVEGSLQERLALVLQDTVQDNDRFERSLEISLCNEMLISQSAWSLEFCLIILAELHLRTEDAVCARQWLYILTSNENHGRKCIAVTVDTLWAGIARDAL